VPIAERHPRNTIETSDNGYLEPFKGDKRKVIGLALELDDLGKGVIGWQVVE
jgi:hypothetical protein